jgi:hypothetical protein
MVKKILYLVEERTWLRLSNSVEIWDIDELIVKTKSGIGIQVLTLAQHVSQVAKATISKKNPSVKKSISVQDIVGNTI